MRKFYSRHLYKRWILSHLFRVRAQLLRRLSGSTCPIQGEFRDSPWTHLRGRKGEYFSGFLVRFQHWECIFSWGAFSRNWECDALGIHIRGSRAIIRSDTGKPFQPISQYAKVIILTHISANFDGGITRAQFSSGRGVHSPRGIHSRSRHTSRGAGQSPGLRARAGHTIWDNFQAIPRGLSTEVKFPNLQWLLCELP
jgi:hypothetical protein